MSKEATTKVEKVLPVVSGKVKTVARSVGRFLWQRKVGIAIGFALAVIPLPFPRTWAVKLNMVPK